MAITNTALAQNQDLVSGDTSLGYVADKNLATVPGINAPITTNMVIGAILGVIVTKILN